MQGKINSLILDMDGVLWREDEPIGNLGQIFKTLVDHQFNFILATNNSTKTVDQYLEKLRRFNVKLNEMNIITSAEATGEYLSDTYPLGGNVYVIGDPGLIKTLAKYGFYHEGDGPLAVIVGMDRDLTYDKIKKATLLIRSGTRFIATNPDRTFPIPEGLVPGAGSIVAAIEAATDVHPIVIGKPSPIMYKNALSRMGADPENTLIVGDRLETDILGGQTVGCKTAVVMSGVATEEQVNRWEPKPDFIANDLGDLVERII